MGLEQQISSLVQASENLTGAVNNKIGEIDKKVDDGIKEVKNAAELALRALPFFTVNGNNDFTKFTTTSAGNPSPYKLGWGNGLDTKFETELIEVRSGSTPSERLPIVRELLDFMGIGANTLHFSAKFNILRVKNISGLSSFPRWALYIPWQHIKRDNWTYMVYCRGKGFNFGPDETFNGSNKDDWRLFRRIFTQSNNATGQYVHVDMYCTSADAEMYIALPSVIPGIYPEDRKLPELFNLTNMTLNEHWDNYDALHNETTGIWNPVAQNNSSS
ncbi:hypothetical protein C5F64_08610 [Photobacterium damselae subsp. damselae]|uniref:hypothetical protein n=1 Tax=Photobacterium damselae TaxID=38293 RepID=UPI000D056C43|nr:hypothetical protein [Photobacterium damselae]MDC4168145.1 hypothetical protein [Photobacterium damselae]PSB88050.1 hypothetical protein C5F64_08610 [Photobacterium damselae subsp. damselae]